jgi:hypothetical protein
VPGREPDEHGKGSLSKMLRDDLLDGNPVGAGIAFGKGTHDESGESVEEPRLLHRREDAVDAVGAFADILDEQDATRGAWSPRSAEEGGEHGEIAAGE